MNWRTSSACLGALVIYLLSDTGFTQSRFAGLALEAEVTNSPALIMRLPREHQPRADKLRLPVTSRQQQEQPRRRGFQETIQAVQPKIVKIKGSGGFQGLEPYQSGFLISSEGHLLTVWSYVLDSHQIVATLNDGQRYDAKLVGYDPQLEIAVLKIPKNNHPFFNIETGKTVTVGSRILSFSNLYEVATGNEPASVLKGVVSARSKRLLRRGAFESNYRGDIYILDAMTNNPGSAGGAITNLSGDLVGIIGKELRDNAAGTWLNFAIPIEIVVSSVLDIRGGKMIVEASTNSQRPAEPWTLELVGVVLVPQVVSRTPPFVDGVIAGTVGEANGIRNDDLIVEINGVMTPTRNDVINRLAQLDRDSPITMTIQRGREFIPMELDLNR